MRISRARMVVGASRGTPQWRENFAVDEEGCASPARPSARGASDHARLTSDQSLLRHLARNRIGNLVYQALNTLWVARPARTRPEELILAQGVDQRFNA